MQKVRTEAGCFTASLVSCTKLFGVSIELLPPFAGGLLLEKSASLPKAVATLQGSDMLRAAVSAAAYAYWLPSCPSMLLFLSARQHTKSFFSSSCMHSSATQKEVASTSHSEH